MRLLRWLRGEDSHVLFEATTSRGKDGKYRLLIYRKVIKDGQEIERKFHAVGLPQGRGTQEEAEAAAIEMLSGQWELESE